MSIIVQPSQKAGFVRVAGRFYRSVDARFRASVLDGSTLPGRYSPADQPTLYLSATPEGVAAAMQAHQRPDSPARVTVMLEVQADHIFDLRDAERCAEAGISLADATAPWQEQARNGTIPPSWQVANRLRTLGAHGLIDPSRKAPGLWHLVLFGWNGGGLPAVTVLG